MDDNADRVLKFLREATPSLDYVEHLEHPPFQVLQDYLHGKLGLNERSWVSAHITTCEQCSATIETLRQGETYQVHPTDEELVAYVYHQLEGDVVLHIKEHLRSCETCARRIEELKKERDEIFEGFVAAYSQAINPCDVDFSHFMPSKGLLARLKRWLIPLPSASRRKFYRYALVYAAAGVAIFTSLGILLSLLGQQRGLPIPESSESAVEIKAHMARIRTGINVVKWLAIAWGVWGGAGLFLRRWRGSIDKKEGSS